MAPGSGSWILAPPLVRASFLYVVRWISGEIPCSAGSLSPLKNTYPFKVPFRLERRGRDGACGVSALVSHRSVGGGASESYLKLPLL